MPGKAIIRWYGPRVTLAVRETLKQRLDVAGEALVEQLQRNVSTPAPPHSAPGQFPHQISGDLGAGFYFTTDRRSLTMRVQNTEAHFQFLEQGTRNMAPRPHARRTLLEMRSRLRAIMLSGGGLRSGRFRFTG